MELELGQQPATLTRLIVGIFAGQTGRGPTRARTTIDHDAVTTVLQDVHTTPERLLIEHEEGAHVLALRRAHQRVMKPALTRAAQLVTGREVVDVLSDHSTEFNLTTITFVLAPARSPHAATPTDPRAASALVVA